MRSLDDLIRIIHESRSGKDLTDAIGELTAIVYESSEIRGQLLCNNTLLSTLFKSYTSRLSKKMAPSLQKRFADPDSQLLKMLCRFEESWCGRFPVFDAWISLQRSKGISIPILSDENNQARDSEMMKLSSLLEELSSIKRSICLIFKELDGVTQAFTPSLEEVFDDLSDSVSFNPSIQPNEREGENDELFLYARDKFDYLTKKLIPRLEVIRRDFELHPEGQRAAQEVSSFLSTIQTSPTYVNLLMLLSNNKRRSEHPGSKPKRYRSDEGDFGDWF